MSDSTLHIGTLASNNVNNIVNDTSKYDEYKEKTYFIIGIVLGIIGTALLIWFGITG